MEARLFGRAFGTFCVSIFFLFSQGREANVGWVCPRPWWVRVRHAPLILTLFPEDCVEPGCGNLSLPEGSETTPVVLCSTPSSLPEFTHTSLVAPPPRPCEVTAGPGTDPVALSPPLEYSCEAHSLPGVYLANRVLLMTAADGGRALPPRDGGVQPGSPPVPSYPDLDPPSQTMCVTTPGTTFSSFSG